MLRVTDLQVHYGKIHAVRKTTFSVARSEIVSIVGANGAGKSTIMWTLAGVLKPSSGEILFDGKPIAGAAPDALVRRGISPSPEGRRSFGPLSVADNLRLGAYVRRGEDAEIEADLQAMYAMVGNHHL